MTGWRNLEAHRPETKKDALWQPRSFYQSSTSPSPTPAGRMARRSEHHRTCAPCDTLGYHRFWVSEHHNNDTIVGSAPEILMSAIAAQTSRIRVGSAGVMLPHYAPYKVAEQFRVLEAIAPGRIDLGLGRAPGSDGRTAWALNARANERAEEFPSDIHDLMDWLDARPLREGHPLRGVRAFPGRNIA